MSHTKANAHFASLSKRQALAAANKAAHDAYEASKQSTKQRAKDGGYEEPAWVNQGNPYPLY